MIYFITATTDGGGKAFIRFTVLPLTRPSRVRLYRQWIRNIRLVPITITAIGCRFVILIYSNDCVIDTYAINNRPVGIKPITRGDPPVFDPEEHG